MTRRDTNPEGNARKQPRRQTQVTMADDNQATMLDDNLDDNNR
jgi:hypothetical protein